MPLLALLVLLVLLVASGFAAAAAGAAATEETGFELPPLPYAYDALEPAIDQETMQVHHNRHFRAYTDNMNTALKTLQTSGLVSKRLRDAAHRALETKSDLALEQSIAIARLEETEGEGEADAVAAAARRPLLRQLRNNGGGYLNHKEYFRSLKPEREGGGFISTADAAKSPLVLALEAKFGSLTKFHEEFTRVAVEDMFGSGWTWLVVEVKTGELSITTSANQDRPPGGEAYRVVVALDLWEHAYVLKRRDRVREYLHAFLSLLDYEQAGTRYELAIKQHKEDEDCTM